MSRPQSPAGFASVYSDGQTADLVRYIRARFAPDAPAWSNLEAEVARLRASSASVAHG